MATHPLSQSQCARCEDRQPRLKALVTLAAQAPNTLGKSLHLSFEGQTKGPHGLASGTLCS